MALTPVASLGVVGTERSSQDIAANLLSDEAVSIIQSLQAQLVHTSWHLREAEGTATKRVSLAEEQDVHFGEARIRQHEDARHLLQAEKEQEETAKHHKLLTDRLAMTQEELIEAKAKHSHLVSGKDCACLREELGRLSAQLTEAQEERQSLRARLVESEESRQRKMQKSVVGHRTADMRRQSQGHVRGARMSEAKSLSAKAVQDQREKDTKVQADRLCQLTEQKEQLESEIQSACKQNIGLEQRMETLRSRNRQLEVQHKKQRAADEEKEAMLRDDLKKLLQRLRVLSDVMRLPADVSRPDAREDDFIESGVPSTTTSPAPSAYASTSSMAGMWSSKRSLALAHSSEGLTEQGNQITEVVECPSLSHAATKAIASRSTESVSPTSQRSPSIGGDGVNVVEESEASQKSNSDTREALLKGTLRDNVVASIDVEASVARTQLLLSEVKGLCHSGK